MRRRLLPNRYFSQMTFAVGPRAATAGHRVIEHDRLDSTNSEALRLLRAGEHGPVWIVTHEQTAGRGRRGREWISSPGNLAVSLLLTETVTPAVAATLGFVASLAVCETCETLAPGVAFAVKWPNDVLANGSKVAGILRIGNTGRCARCGCWRRGESCERTGRHDLSGNLDSEARSQHLARSRLRPPERLLCPHDRIWKRGQGFSEIRDFGWIVPRAGKAISIRIGNRVQDGIFETLDEQGRLVLRMADGSVGHGQRRRRLFRTSRKRRSTGLMAPTGQLVFAPLGGVGEIG